VADDRQLQAWGTVVAVYQSVLHDVVRALEDDAGVDSGVFSALAYLARAAPAGRLRLTELRDRMHPRYSQPGLSRLVQRMEAAGLVDRHADPGDGRAAVVVMTAAGRALFARADDAYTAAVREHFGQHLSSTQARALESALRPVLQGRARRGARSRTVRTR
jgi:DNA-binding MarR family transcriptional regulator